MKRKLQKGYRWKKLTKEGLLVSPLDRHGKEIFSKYFLFPDTESAVQEYKTMHDMYSELPHELVLIEVYEFVTDWD
jgi:hypothetical protein